MVPGFDWGDKLGLSGVEPLTSSLSATRSNQLSYKPFQSRGFLPKVIRNPSYDPHPASQAGRFEPPAGSR